ncbi:MAG: hypothetical protein QOD28_1121 [Acidobacteriota bacterium]|nr:hypothetical protein [Acidobacteriota bacterium]
MAKKNQDDLVKKTQGRLTKKKTKNVQGTLRKYRFKIDAYSPETMPLGRLAEYLAELSVLFGEDKSVHLIEIEGGSTVPVFLVEREAEPKVQERLSAVARKDAPQDAMRAAKNIDEKLRKDNAVGYVTDPTGGKVIAFPGREYVEPLTYGPFNQTGIIIGVPIMVGGKNDPVPVHLEGTDGTFDCLARREIAKDIAPHLFTKIIRAEGTGRWTRHSNGEWEMVKFTIKYFQTVPDTSLREAIQKFRDIPAAWKEKEDPLGEIMNIRHGTDG